MKMKNNGEGAVSMGLRGDRVDEFMKRSRATSGYEVLWNYFRDVIRRESFKKELGLIREKYRVPREGFLFADKGYPKYAKQWMDDLTDQIEDAITADLIELMDRYYLPGFLMTKPMFQHFLVNTEVKDDDCFWNLCHIVGEDGDDRFDQSMPITLKISPLASKKNITDYIEKVFGEFEFSGGECWDAELDGARPRKKRLDLEVQDLIWDFRDKPLKEICNIVKEETRGKMLFDQGEMGKLLSEIRRRRER